MSVNTNNLPLSDLQNIYDTQQTILGDMRDNDILLPGMSADDFREINKAIGELNLEGGQPDPVGDAPSATSQFSAVDAALNDISLDRSIDARATLDTYGVTAKDALDRARSLATYEDTLGVAVSTIGKIAGPTIATVVEALREHPRQSYREMVPPLAALHYYSPEYEEGRHDPVPHQRGLYDLPQPTSIGLGTRADPSTKNTFFGFDIDKRPVGHVPMDQFDEPPDRDQVSSMTPSQQMETMSESKRSGIGESEGEEGAEQTSAEAAAASASYGGGFGGGHGPDTGMGPPDMGADMGWNTGGRVGALIQHLQTGGEAENADTNMEVANVPMGVVSDADGAPSPFSGGTGVEDDLEMEVDAGSYVLNAESVQLIGISDINAVIRDAYTIAVALGKEVPADYDPQNKVPIRISNGEAVIPKALVDIIGLDKLEKWNKKGLQLRKQKEKMMAQQQQQQPPQQQQVASEAPMQQQMGQLMDRGGKVDDGGKVQNFFDDSIDTVKNPENMTREELENLFRTADTGPEGPENINKDIIIEEKEIPLPISKPESPLTGLAIEKLKRGIQGTVDQADDLLIKGLEKIQSFSLKEDKSRGMRNKNPFNISFITSRNPNRHGASAFHGVTGTDRLSGGTKKENRRFYLQFNNIDNGLRAGARTLRGKKYNGKTLEDIIKTFSSTDQKAYINFVAKKLNVKPDTIINTDKDDIILEKLMKAMLEFESTKKALEDISDEQIKNAIQRSKEDLPDSNYYRK